MTGGADVYLNHLWRTLCGGDVYDWSLACVGSEHFQYFAIKIYKSLLFIEMERTKLRGISCLSLVHWHYYAKLWEEGRGGERMGRWEHKHLIMFSYRQLKITTGWWLKRQPWSSNDSVMFSRNKILHFATHLLARAVAEKTGAQNKNIKIITLLMLC